MDRFAILLDDLGTLIDVPLHPDHHRACILLINNQLHVHITEEENKDRLMIAAFVSEVPPGKFRENILKEALKENNLFPRLGTFSYSDRNNQLALVSYIPLAGLRGDNFADFLEKFFEKSFSWKTGVETGQLPARGQTIQKSGPSIFDVQKK